MGLLRFWYGTMGAGKSLLALQRHHNFATRAITGVLLTKHDRADSQIATRAGLSAPALKLDDDTDVYVLLKEHADQGALYVIVDEAQFLTPSQVDDLAASVDDFDLDVQAFGLLTDFRGHLFPGSARLVELSDGLIPLPAAALCWCGKPATHNARVENGVVVHDGEVVVVGDMTGASVEVSVGYEPLCRAHHRNKTLGPT